MFGALYPIVSINNIVFFGLKQIPLGDSTFLYVFSFSVCYETGIVPTGKRRYTFYGSLHDQSVADWFRGAVFYCEREPNDLPVSRYLTERENEVILIRKYCLFFFFGGETNGFILYIGVCPEYDKQLDLIYEDWQCVEVLPYYGGC